MSFEQWEEEMLNAFSKPPNFFDSDDKHEYVVISKTWDCGWDWDDVEYCLSEYKGKASAIKRDLSIDLEDLGVDHEIRVNSMKDEGIVFLDIKIDGKKRPHPKSVVNVLEHYGI